MFEFCKKFFVREEEKQVNFSKVKLDPVKTGKFIKRLRKKNGYSQYTLAAEIKISRQAVSKWERGITIPSRETLIKLSNLFDMTINDLLKQGEDKE